MKLQEVIQAFLSDLGHEDRTNLLCTMLKANLDTKKDEETKVVYRGEQECEIIPNAKNKFIDELKRELTSP